MAKLLNPVLYLKISDNMENTLREEFRSQKIDSADAELFKGCLRGDEASWAALVDRYQRLIYAIPRRAGLNEDQCEEVFQEVFLVLLEKLDKIEQPEKIRSWIVTTAKFKTWAVIRAAKGDNSPLSDSDMEDEVSRLADRLPLPDAVLLELEQQHLIRTALKTLEERCQKILSMIYLRDNAATYFEVAETIGVGESSISPLRARCLKKLEKLIGK